MVYRGTTRFWAKIPVFWGFSGSPKRGIFRSKSGPEPGFGSRARFGPVFGRCDSGKCAFSKPWVLGVQAPEMLFRVLWLVFVLYPKRIVMSRPQRDLGKKGSGTLLRRQPVHKPNGLGIPQCLDESLERCQDRRTDKRGLHPWPIRLPTRPCFRGDVRRQF